jgi:hypothetical protein
MREPAPREKPRKVLRIAARGGIVILAASLACGCILFPDAKDKAMRNTPAFQDGYSDGCAAASAPAANFREGPYRDETLYDTDSTYRAGWANGYQTCRPIQPGSAATPGTSPIPEPQIGGH